MTQMMKYAFGFEEVFQKKSCPIVYPNALNSFIELSFNKNIELWQ